jgi:hypothetical protein
MLTLRGNNKHTDQEELRMLWFFALTTVLVLAIAGFVGIVF